MLSISFGMMAGSHRLTSRFRKWPKPSMRLGMPGASLLRFFCSSAENLTGLISCLCSTGKATEAFKLLSMMNVKESSFKLDIYNKVLESLITSGNMTHALHLFEQMKVEFPLNQGSYVFLLRMLCKAGCIDDACRHVADMGRLGYEPDISLVTELVNDLCKASKWKSCHKLLTGLYNVGFIPSLATFNTFFSCLCRAGLMQQACKLLDDMVKLGFTLDVYTYSIMIHTLCKAEKVDEAYKLLKAMRNRKCEPDVVCYSTVLHGYVRLGKQELAMKIMDEMRRNNCSPDVVTYNSLISMFSKVGDTTKAYELWGQMRANGCVPDHISYTALVDGFCRQNKPKECLRLVLEMLKKRLKPGAPLQRKLQDCLERHGVDADMRGVLQDIEKYGVDLRLPTSMGQYMEAQSK